MSRMYARLKLGVPYSDVSFEGVQMVVNSKNPKTPDEQTHRVFDTGVPALAMLAHAAAYHSEPQLPSSLWTRLCISR